MVDKFFAKCYDNCFGPEDLAFVFDILPFTSKTAKTLTTSLEDRWLRGNYPPNEMLATTTVCQKDRAVREAFDNVGG